MRRIVPLLAGVVAFGVVVRSLAPPPDVVRPNVVLVVVDALRRDHVGAYGHGQPTTPFLDELASRGALFENAWSQAPQTFNATAALLTGRVAPLLVERADASSRPVGSAIANALANDNDALAEVLAAGGYDTLGVFTNPHHEQSSGFEPEPLVAGVVAGYASRRGASPPGDRRRRQLGDTRTNMTSRRPCGHPFARRAGAGFGLVLVLGLGTAALWGCSDRSSASESEPLCIAGALPLGERTPLIDAVCTDPPSALSAAAEQQQRANAEAAATSAAQLQRTDAITIVTCGTGTPLPSDRVQACTAVFANGLFLLFDAGDGAERSIERSLLPITDIDAIFLTHFHSDHIADVGEVISRSWILGRTTSLPVYGGDAVQRVVDGFNAVYALDDNYREAHHGEDILDSRLEPADPHTIADPGAEGRVVFEREGVVVKAFRVNHPPIEPALGYRIEYAGRSVVISGDTTDTASLRAMSTGADVLVSEVMSRDVLEAVECALRRLDDPRNARLIRDIRTYHIGTTELAELAQSAGVRTLVLTHQVPSFDNDDPRADLLLAAPIRALYSGELIAARDGQRIVVELE